MKLRKLITSVIRRQEFRIKPIKVILNIIKWQIRSRLNQTVLYNWHGDILVNCQKSDTGFTGDIYYGLMERDEASLFLTSVNTNDLFVDVGANIGSYTLLISKFVGARCIAIEPSPATFKKLSKNIELNKFTRAKTLNIAAGESEKKVYLTKNLGPENFIVNGVSENLDQVTQSKLDNTIKGKVNFLKIDTEGNELNVLKGAKRILSSHSLMIVMCEVNEKYRNFGLSDDLITPYLNNFGFVSCTINNGELSRGENFGNNRIFIRPENFEILNHRILNNKGRLEKISF